MSDPIRAECEQFVDELLQLEARDRPARIFDLCKRSIDEDAPVLAIVTGLVLRDRDNYEWADYVFNLALRIPGARGMALFELAVSLGLQGRPLQAIALLRDLEKEQPLGAYQLRSFAVQLARKGEYEEASRRLEQSYELEPTSETECVALRQFFDYQRRVPYEEMHARCRALFDAFPLKGVAQLAADVRAALREKRGYSMIRVNDGEGSILHLSVDDEAQYRDLYTRNRRHFHRWWFGHEEKVFAADWLEAVRHFNDVLANTDCIGANILAHLEVRHRQGDLQNISCLFNIVRKLEQIRDTPGRKPDISLTDPVIHQFMLFDGELERLLQEQTRIGLVSCHAALPEALKKRFGLSEVVLHKTPGEGAITGGVDPEPFGVWYHRLRGELAHAEPGLLYLCAGGVAGKIYCDLIKRAGGVAIDVGSVADIWMKAPTRQFWQVAEQHVLTPA